MPAPEHVTKVANQLAQLVSTSSQAAILAATNGNNNKVDAILIAATGAIGAIHVLSQLIGWHGDKERRKVEPADIVRLSNPTSTLMAALLVHNMSPESIEARPMQDDATKTEVGMEIAFSPEILWTAVQQTERIMGRPVDGYIDPNLLSSLKEQIAGSDEPLNKFMAQFRPTPGGLQ